jgi:hypothetical protein
VRNLRQIIYVVEEITACRKRWKDYAGRRGVVKWRNIAWNFKPTEQRKNSSVKNTTERGF